MLVVSLYVIKLDSIMSSLTGADGSIICDQVRLDHNSSHQCYGSIVCDQATHDQMILEQALIVALYVIKLDAIKDLLSSSDKH